MGKSLLPALAVATLMLSACAGPSADEFRQRDVQGNTACIHFGSGYTDDGSVGRANMAKAAEHGAASSTESIRAAVSTDAAGVPVITDEESFKSACEAQGMRFK
ncbi:hypothetical protein [Paeniglutamicibacter sulfureus]|jgi:hypothetical protein|uniref:Transglutaminase/protease-like cytokinesis protein 3 n=1 Tax=Paeniglutamicibacter sulfureus TaxID=43666 RepID=A0ABU2BDZ6_9MICC|nr:hypothetical protein [Paeniglutamicibacter sulfureus]MDO2936522.1 hypothetical protein [Paeniglutamicibacter sulfureus]MDR7356830.1 transglutaminase/protease-like cytokinesis protein 3 [Paeniglutamicibacter sulfureus]